MASILRGKPVADRITEELRTRAEALRAAGCPPTLAIVRAGSRPDDLAYERGARKRAELAGVSVRTSEFKDSVPAEELLAEIRALNEDPTVHGILVFRPLPAQIPDEAVRRAIAPWKDVDGVTDASMAAVYAGTWTGAAGGEPAAGTGFAPCTAEACLAILDHYGIDPAGRSACVVGRSLVIGRPAALMLLKRNATVTIAHTRTPDLAACCRAADIVVACAGHIGTVTKDCLREGQIVLDVAVNFLEDGAMTGDVDREAAEAVCEALTPVPGGVGTVTSTILMRHVILAAEASFGH